VCQARKKNEQATPSTDKKSDTPQTTHQRGKRTPRGEKRDLGTYSLFSFGSKRPAPYKVQLSVGGQPLEKEVDTGASLSAITERIYDKFVSEKSALSLEKSRIVLRKYTGEEFKPKGS